MIFTYFKAHVGQILTYILQFSAILPLNVADSKLDTIELVQETTYEL